MGTITDKLSYLNTTKGKIKDSINLTGANIGNNDTFRSYSAKLRDSLVDIINNGTDDLYDNFPKATGTGSEIELNNTYEAPMGIDLKGNTHQESTTGKNLLDLSEITTGTHYGLEITNNNDGSITLNGSPTAGISFILPKSFILKSGVTYCLSLGNNRQNSADAKFILRNGNTNIVEVLFISGITTYTPSADTTIDIVRIYSPAGIIYNNFTILPMLEVGNTRTEFEIYTNGASPNPDYPQNIEVVTGNNSINICGKNLFDKDNANIINAVPDTTSITSSSFAKSFYVKIKPNTTYTVSREIVGSRFVIGTTQNIPSVGEAIIDRTVNNSGSSITFTSSSTANYLVVYYLYNSSENETTILSSMQVELGLTATTYEAYQGATYPINLGKNLFDASIQAGTYGTTTYTVASDGLITQSSTDGSAWDISQNRVFYLEAGTYTFSINVTSGTTHYLQLRNLTDNTDAIITSQYTKATFTLNNRKALAFKTYGSNGVYPVSYYIQIEKGSQATTYSPYKTPIELCKIGDYQDEIRRSTGKNLLDTSSFYAGYINSSGVVTGDNKQALFDYIKVTPGTSYTISAQQTVASLNIALYDENKNFISRTVQTENPRTFTLPNTAYYVRIWFKYSDTYNMTQDIINNSKIQFEKNSTATDYEPYGVGVWYKYGKIGKVVFKGENSEGWSYDFNKCIRCLDNSVMPSPSNTELPNILSNYYTRKKQLDIQNGTVDYGVGIRISPTLGFVIRNKNCNSISDYTTWLSTHNTIVYYPLATPTTTEITNTELISQLGAIYNAYSYNNQTNISQENAEQPFILNVSALLREE